MPFDEMRRRQQQIARRRKKKKFSLVLPQITISSPHYNNDVDIRYSNKIMKYIVYSIGKLFFCYFVLYCFVLNVAMSSTHKLFIICTYHMLIL